MGKKSKVAITQIRTTADLHAYLKENSLSPERFAERVKVSNMTIRRLLQKPGKSVLPEKYYAQFDSITNPGGGQVELAKLLGTQLSLENGGSIDSEYPELAADLLKMGKNVSSVEKLEGDLRSKQQEFGVGAFLWAKAQQVLGGAKSNGALRLRSLCLGALLYFINPMDIVPDLFPGIGFVDDLAVLTIVAAMLAGGKKSR